MVAHSVKGLLEKMSYLSFEYFSKSHKMMPHEGLAIFLLIMPDLGPREMTVHENSRSRASGVDFILILVRALWHFNGQTKIIPQRRVRLEPSKFHE
jgi:hypothetical protein